MNISSAARGAAERKSQRTRELEELRSQGRTKSLREKLKDFSTPIQTAEEAKHFLLARRDQSKKESWTAQESSRLVAMNSVDYDSFLTMQRKRHQELKLRRREAEQLLHGFRGYGEIFGAWSPRRKPRERASFGFGSSIDDALLDPTLDHSPSRRKSSMPRLEHNWDEVESRDDQFGGEHVPPNPLDPNCADFLNDSKHYDGTQYPRTSQEMEVASGVSMFSPNNDQSCEETQNINYRDGNHFREPPPQSSHHPMFSEEDFLDGHQEYIESQYPDRTINQEIENANSVVLFDKDDSTHDANLDRRKPISSSSPYQTRKLNLKVKTKREDQIDVTPSEKRLRQAGNVGGDNRNDEFNVDESVSKKEPEITDIRLTATDGVTTEVHGSIFELENQKEVKNNEGYQYSTLSKSPAPPVDAIYHEKESSVLETVWRDFVRNEPGAKYPPEVGRYHLYASYACPGSHRALIVRALKGLEGVISVTIVHPTWRHTNPKDGRDKHRGWIFGDPDGKPFLNTMGRGGPFPPAYANNTPDPILNAYSVRNLYEYAHDTSGKYTIPVLWDKKLNTIVNNESSDISYMLNSSFNEFSQNPELDLYTEDDEDGLDRLNEVSQWLYPMMIHGVYRCGFAKTQRAYDQAIEELTEAFDAADELLQHQRYVVGDILTDADIRLFVTLLRFDEVYAFYFRANTRLVIMTPALLNFCREIYQMPGVAETCQMDQIKAHFFGSHAEWNKYSVVPKGLGFMKYLDMPHDRHELANVGHI